MSKKRSVLFLGETTIAQSGSIKGYNVTFSIGYEESYLMMKDMIEKIGYEFTNIPSHLIARDFPRTMEELRRYDVILVSDLGADPHCDVIVTSTILQGNYNMPVVRALSFLTGIGMEKDLQKIIEILKTIN